MAVWFENPKALTALIVFLTLSIAGGPFLGLLGTVVGVMITFAAIAAAGDVNVNAIAPGIAAALWSPLWPVWRRDPGSVWVQLPDFQDQGRDERHACLRRRVRDKNGRVLLRCSGKHQLLKHDMLCHASSI